jgi:hypothetical protein
MALPERTVPVGATAAAQLRAAIAQLVADWARECGRTEAEVRRDWVPTIAAGDSAATVWLERRR